MSRAEGRARAFLERAEADLAAVRALEHDHHVPDEIVGFHAQQCAEKLLKAVLAAREIEFPRTHSLQYLLDRLSDNDTALVPSLHAVTELYPYAIQFRYEAPLEDESLHRPSMLVLLEQLRTWAIDQLSSSR